MIIDMTIPGDTKVCDKERDKVEKYSLLKGEIVRIWQMKKVVVIPTVVGALGNITTKFEKYIESLGIEIRIDHAHKSVMLGMFKGTNLLSTQERICSHIKNLRYQHLSSVRNNIEHNNNRQIIYY